MGQDTVASVKEIGMVTINRTLETSYGQYVVDKVSDALTVSEDYVEKYLPPCEEEEDRDGGQYCLIYHLGDNTFVIEWFAGINCIILWLQI